jgi:hypothetical protein
MWIRDILKINIFLLLLLDDGRIRIPQIMTDPDGPRTYESYTTDLDSQHRFRALYPTKK